ncbi:MAG: hypothetical protein J6O18_02545 [Bacilli bacterium]|nr:hypothetical protein [Bacilli bacterium]
MEPFVIGRKSNLSSFTGNGAESSAMYFFAPADNQGVGLGPERYVAKAIELAAFRDPLRMNILRFCLETSAKHTTLIVQARRFEPTKEEFIYTYLIYRRKTGISPSLL